MPHSRTQRETRVFTYSTCLHCSHVDQFLVFSFHPDHKGLCEPLSFMRPRPPSVRRERLESRGTQACYIGQLNGFSDGLSE